MHISRRDGLCVTFSTSAISSAVSKALLRHRQRELMRQKDSYCIACYSIAHELGHILMEEEYYRNRIEQKQIEEELQFIKLAIEFKNEDDRVRIKELLLAQQRGMSRSTAMRYATDLSLVTMPTPPTVETAIGSLSCGRITYASV